MKKVLALIVAFALCFTAFAGCFATSAAAPLSFTITGSIADDNGAATVTVSGSYEIRTAQLLTVTLDSKLKFEGVENGINIDEVDHVTDETPENLYSVEGNVIKFIDDYTGNFEIVINVTAPANDGATDATYDVTASADIAGWEDTEVSSVEPVTAVVTVKAAVVEPQGPVLDENIELLTHSISIGETFGAVLKFKQSSLSSEYKSFRLDVKRTYNAGGYNFGYENTSFESLNVVSSRDCIQSPTIYGFELYSLTAPIEYTLHCFDADGNEIAYSQTFTTTLAEIAVNYHNSDESSDKIKKVMADMIQVGAAALNHFTSNKTKACDYSTLPVPTIESSYITTELGALASYNSSEGVKVTIAGALSQSAYFNMTFAEDVANKEQYRFVVSFYNAVGKREVVTEIPGSSMKGNATTIMASLASFPLFSTNQDVTFELYKEGATDPVAVNHYCMEQYYADTLAKSNSATLKALIQELGEMAQSIRTARNI